MATKNATPIFLDLHGVAASLTLSVTAVQRLVREDLFPKPRQLSRNRVGWLSREVMEWAESRPVSQIPPPANTGASKRKEAA